MSDDSAKDTSVPGLIARVHGKLAPNVRTLQRQFFTARLTGGQTSHAVTGLREHHATNATLVNEEQRAQFEIFDRLKNADKQKVIDAIQLTHTPEEVLSWELNRLGVVPASTPRAAPITTKPRRRPKPDSHIGVIMRVIEEWPHLKGAAYCRKVHDFGAKTKLAWQKSGCPASYPEAYKSNAVLKKRSWKRFINDEKSKTAARLDAYLKMATKNKPA
jgi:hypothetical protein